MSEIYVYQGEDLPSLDSITPPPSLQKELNLISQEELLETKEKNTNEVLISFMNSVETDKSRVTKIIGDDNLFLAFHTPNRLLNT